MKKNRLYLIISVLTAIFFFIISAASIQCTALKGEETEFDNKEEVSKTEESKESKESNEVSEEIEGEEESVEEEATEEESSEDGKEVTKEEELEAPKIEIKIYEGPLFSEADEVCYWRLEAIVTGNPTPEVEFSKDDSEGTLGSGKCQININDPFDTYTLTATATNSEGSSSDSINLSWGCEEEPSGGEAGGDTDGDFEPPEWEGRDILDYPEMIFSPFEIGYIVYPTGVNTTGLIIGDSTSNTDVRGFFAFDLITLRGKEIVSATLRLNTYKYYPDPSFKGKIIISFREYLPLDAGDYNTPPGLIITFPFENSENPIEFNLFTSYVQEKVDDSCILGFCVWYESSDTDWDHEVDGREYTKDSIELTMRYID
jgi:hypothetical protein